MKHAHVLVPALLASCVLLTPFSSRAQQPEAVEHYRAGYRLLKSKNYRNAALELEQSVALDSTYGSAYFALGIAYRVLDEYSKAIHAYERARELGALPDRATGELSRLYRKAGIQLFSERKYGDAAASFRKALALNPRDARSMYAIGLCYNGLREDKAAEEMFRKAAAADSAYAKPLRALGDLYRRKGDLVRAATEYRRALEVDSTYMQTYSGLAQTLLETKDFHGAATLMRRAIAIDPRFADGYLYLGTALNRLERYDEAVNPLTRATQLARSSAEAQYRLGEAQYGRGAYREALAAGRQAIRLRRNFHPAELLLADACFKLGKMDEARSWYRRAMQDSRFRDYSRHQLDEIEHHRNADR